MSSKNTTRTLRGHHCQCVSCGECFNSAHAFDRHRVGRPGVDRRCMSAFEMRRAGMIMSVTGWWITGKNGHRFLVADSKNGDRQAPVGLERGAA